MARSLNKQMAFKEMRKVVPEQLRYQSLVRAASVLAVSLMAYFASVLMVLVTPWWLMPITGLLLGVTGNVLFVVAHDAAHGSFTQFRWLNGLIARLCFVPSWHAFTGWVHAHNHVHHGWTNLRTKDYVWAPITKAEYDRLSPNGKALLRFYRSRLGFAAYYLYEINLKRIFWLQPEVHNFKIRRKWVADDLGLLLAVAAQAALLIELGRRLNPTAGPYWILAMALVVPAITTNYLVGFITYLQHTHPSIPWFDSLREWTYYIGQVRGTTHTRFPYSINSLFHNVMDHTAHHVDPHIPLYHLRDAQIKIEQTYPGDIVQHNFTFHSLRRTLRMCQLYNFENHCWMSYDGEQTSSQTVHFEDAQSSLHPIRSL